MRCLINGGILYNIYAYFDEGEREILRIQLKLSDLLIRLLSSLRTLCCDFALFASTLILIALYSNANNFDI